MSDGTMEAADQTEAAATEAPAGAPATTSAAIGAPTVDGATPGMQRFVLPSFPFRLVWSPRKPWVVSTRLADREIADVFTTTMTRRANLLRRMNNYYRRVRWTARHDAASGDVIATCHADGPVVVGIGRSKILADVDGNTMRCRIERDRPDGRAHVAIGVGTYATWLWLYLFPPTAYAKDVVKALRRADPTAEVGHPWSIVRVVALVACAIAALVAAGG